MMISKSEVTKIGIVFAVLAVLLAGFLVLKLKKPAVPKITATPSPTVVLSANRFYIEPSSFIISEGDEFKVNIYITAPGKKISGADAVLRFDPAFLEVVEITGGTYFQELPRKTIDGQRGLVKITGFRPADDLSLTEKIPFAVLSLKARQAGITQLKFDFQKGTTNMTTIVEKGTSKNVLDSAGEARIEIK